MALADKTISAESGGDRFAKNPRSSAYGPGQFLSSTWLGLMRKYRPDLAEQYTPDQLLAMRTDADLSREMVNAYNGENASYLKARGFEPNEGNLYLAYFAGPAGAAKVLSNPQASAASILGQDVMEANPHLKGWTGQQVADWAGRKMGWQPATYVAQGAAPESGPGKSDSLLPSMAPPPTATAAAAPAPKQRPDAVIPFLMDLFGGATAASAATPMAGAGGAAAGGSGGLLSSLFGGGGGGEDMLSSFLKQSGGDDSMKLAQGAMQGGGPQPFGSPLQQRPIDLSALQALVAQRPQLGNFGGLRA